MSKQSTHPENAVSFARLSHEDQVSFAHFFDGLTLSLSAEREFLEWLFELAFTRKKTVSDILLSPEFSSIQQNAKLNPPQKIAAIRNTLYIERFPLYAKTLAAWKQLVAKTNKNPSQVQLSPSPYFEKNQLEIKVRVTSADQAKKIFENLAAIDSATWDFLISPSTKQEAKIE